MFFVNFFDNLARAGIVLDERQRRLINQRIAAILSYEPRIGFFGKTGVGKSSLCNALFGKDLFAINDVEACTRNPQESLLGLDQKGIKLVDVPGVGESGERDAEYAELYASLLPELDVILWVLKADDRAFTSDEVFYTTIVKPHLDQGKPFFFVLNQVDKMEPFREWDMQAREPGPRQLVNITRKIQDVSSRFAIPTSRCIPVSANEKYNLMTLVNEIVFALPNEKRVTVFQQVLRENRSEKAQQAVNRSFREIVSDVVAKVAQVTKDAVNYAVDKVESVVQGVCDWVASWF